MTADSAVAEPYRLVSVAQMRALEAAAVAAGTSERDLQERAGLAVAEVADALRRRPGRLAALVGRGNNGRDAVVAVRVLARRGWRAELWLAPGHAVEPQELAALRDAGLDAHDLEGAEAAGRLEDGLRGVNVALDGLLGVGARGPMRSPLLEFAEALNRVRRASGAPIVVAVDVPSGIDADTGEVPGVAVRVDVTVTLGAVKTGLLRFPAAEYVGRLEPRAIGLPDEPVAALPVHILADQHRPAPPPRPLSAHKYDFGRLLVVGGSSRFVGAPFLAAAGAARAGAGLVILAGPEPVKRLVSLRLPEATYTERAIDPETEPEAALQEITPALETAAAVVIGPGMGRSSGASRFLRALLEARRTVPTPPPTVIDGDGLSLLAEWPEWPDAAGSRLVLTPHYGEMARLIGASSETVAADPWAVAAEYASRWGQVVVLKGPFTAIAGPDDVTWVYPRANPGLATAGTGDVLAGTIGGLLAQGMRPLEAALLGVWVHAQAGARVIRRRRWRTLLASDLLREIPRLLAAPPTAP